MASSLLRSLALCTRLNVGMVVTRSVIGAVRGYATASKPVKLATEMKKLRNIGISAHIDSGKTTLTERVLYYTGRIHDMHEVKGSDGEGATMDFMELEREKGITIQSAATFCQWGEHYINIIDTPGHVDFTIEVERALRVLDSAVLVLCGVSGVQSQTFTVDRQMKRYNVPRLAFINKLDRIGAQPFRVVSQLRDKLGLNASAMQIPIGVEHALMGVVDIISNKALNFSGEKGARIDITDVPAQLHEQVSDARAELIERVANVDDQLAEWLVINDYPTNQPPEDELKAAIRRATIARRFVPVFLGSAKKNTGIQPLLDGVVEYLPNPMEVENRAIEVLPGNAGEKSVVLQADVKKPFVALAFKLEEGRFGQLTYMRVYQGAMRRGDLIRNANTDKQVKVPRLVKMHANSMEDIQEIGAGEICALFGIECSSGHTFLGPTGPKYLMSSMHVPDPVLSLAITVKAKDQATNFTKALGKFQKEDPTFRVKMEQESNEIVISGMGELHLQIYVERLRREFGVEATVGKPLVAYRETIVGPGKFDYLHKKQSGGAGQYARVVGVLEPMEWEGKADKSVEFLNETTNGSIPPQYLEACRKGFMDMVDKGPLLGQPMTGLRMIINDGAYHAVDSSELAFRICTQYAFREGFKKARAAILEPVMTLEVQTPSEYQGPVAASLGKRRAVVTKTETIEDQVIMTAEVPLNNMFGYSMDLRTITQGKAEFSMEYKCHRPVTQDQFNQLVEEHAKRKEAEKK